MTAELLTDFYGQSPSEAALIATNQQAVTQIQLTLTSIKEQLIASDVAHFGRKWSTGRRPLTMAACGQYTRINLYQIDKRGQDGMRTAGILPLFQGTAVHDHWAFLFSLDHCQHAFCNAHHLRTAIHG
ncbi:MAG: transposase [Caldilineaceae bacterium]